MYIIVANFGIAIGLKKDEKFIKYTNIYWIQNINHTTNLLQDEEKVKIGGTIIQLKLKYIIKEFCISAIL